MLALIQFDAAALPLVERMAAEGRLPTFAALRREGHWEPIDGGATLLQASTYPTLCTGIGVGDHGLYSAFPWSAGDQRVRFMHTFPKPATIWDRVAAAGGRSLVIDPVLAWAPGEMSGVYLNGWNFEDRMLTQSQSAPGHVRGALAARYGRPPKLHDVYGRRPAATLLEWRPHLVAGPGRTADAALDLLRRDAFDLVWVSFTAAHKAGHQFWDPLPVVGDISPSDADLLQKGLEDVYIAVDRAMARLMDALPPDADIIVFSPTGMGANTSRADLLPGMLAALLGRTQPSSGRRRASAPVWALRSSVPVPLRAAIARLLPDRVVANLTTRLYTRADWTRTRAIAAPGENKGYVRLNLRGREREGLVAPAEADALLSEIARGLLTFREPDGRPTISAVTRIGDLVGHAPALDRLPDLVISWAPTPATGVTRAASPEFGEVERLGVGSGRSGNHDDDAWAILLTRHTRVRPLDRPMRVVDVGATVCQVLGADMTGLSGTSILERAS